MLFLLTFQDLVEGVTATQFARISSDFLLTRILTNWKNIYPDHSGKEHVASANYPNLHVKDFKQRYNLQTNILLSDKRNFKAALDMFYTAMIVNVIFL